MSDPFATWVEQLADVEVPEMEDFKALTPLQIVQRLEDIDDRLRELREPVIAKTEEGRALHSQRGALTVWLHEKAREAEEAD